MSRRVLFELRVPDGRVAGVDFLLQEGEEPGEMRQHQGPLLGRHLVLLGTKLVQQLFPHGLKYGFEKRPEENIFGDASIWLEYYVLPSEYEGCIKMWQRVTESRHMAVAKPEPQSHDKTHEMKAISVSFTIWCSSLYMKRSRPLTVAASWLWESRASSG